MASFFIPLSPHLLRDILGDERVAPADGRWLSSQARHQDQHVQDQRLELEQRIHRLRLEKGGLC
ncbi:hypothetical protein HNO92_000792 [Chromobacterium alkanivorans]|uniref:hypothetical protein n=1 Tax=Chromobacterium TaxID=535 RepID=UPI0006529F85|nr:MULTISPECIES: hypothetical protein [Chromobacterium]KMN83201.1 hypothetical protein VK98_04500 [Chromobacterium sp. LK11]MBN3004834.1 hypothetical protein [Chromobacterium alkanivorans]MCS3803132.1 hypothetical protein [Chromobacterium alkanivorans]MCS3817758.1 hypothetical protein [Chromobacterium alkanivorans]MCS3872498.1 hypothetical protein [Chromobacterium alkanivorans]